MCQPCAGDNLLYGDDEDVDTDLALLDVPIVGAERVLADQHGLDALEARALTSPPTMTPAAFLKHCPTHLPPPWLSYVCCYAPTEHTASEI